jgi:Holliday junction resolvase
MGANSRVKGATFERHIAISLELELGIQFKRNLEQTRAMDQADLVADDPDFPFVLECKRYAGGSFLSSWWDQVTKAAKASNKLPCVIYKFDRKDIQVAIDWRAIGAMTGAEYNTIGLIHMDIASFCFVAREIIAGRN